MDPKIVESMERLLEVAERDTGQSRKVANFLLGWWNAPVCGGFDLTDLWGLDAELQRDIVYVIVYIVGHQGHYADRLVSRSRMERLVRDWRPKLFAETGTDDHRWDFL